MLPLRVAGSLPRIRKLPRVDVRSGAACVPEAPGPAGLPPRRLRRHASVWSREQMASDMAPV
jgi:hypothetical protein